MTTVYDWRLGMPRGAGSLADGVLDARPTADLAAGLDALIAAYAAEVAGHARRTPLATVVTHLTALRQHATPNDRSQP